MSALVELGIPLVRGATLSGTVTDESGAPVAGVKVGVRLRGLVGRVLDDLREVESDETGGFTCFIPLSFHPANTQLEHIQQAGGTTDLRIVAVSRLMLDNIPHIKTYWVMTGVKTAQTALLFGADDLDGTVIEEKITHMAGASSPEYMGEAELRRLIREAGRTPVRRDSVYNEFDAPADPALATA